MVDATSILLSTVQTQRSVVGKKVKILKGTPDKAKKFT
jgi:hypothetical protein